MNKVMELKIILDETYTVEKETGKITMVLFHGECDSEFFHGNILPGGVDTQTYMAGTPGVLSARYMIDGVNCNGEPARMFIENMGAVSGGEILTHPVIYTDNKRLQWIEKAKLTGKIANKGEELLIEFWEE